MNINAKIAGLDISSDALIIYVFQGDDASLPDETAQIDNQLGGEIAERIADGELSGAAAETLVIHSRGRVPAKRVIVVGLGEQTTATLDTVRRASATAVTLARKLKAASIATVCPQVDTTEPLFQATAQAIAEGAILGSYQYHGQKSTPAPESVVEDVSILTDEENESFVSVGIREGLAYAEGTLIARDLANLPPNICTPEYVARRAVEVGEATGQKVTVLGVQQMRALKMGALLAVAQGSENPPRFVVMEHNAGKTELPAVVLVGKGVTFDTGGYSLKTVDGMVGMKLDMSGAAAVIGAMHTVTKLDVPLRVVGLIPTSDNMVDAKAYRPQDVITASNGKTIEIISTDAEGRLLLADALVYAKRYEPAVVVDIATLTGSIILALGKAAGGLFATDDQVAQTLIEAGDVTDERLWRMPIFDEYNAPLESDTADTKNSGGKDGRYGGAGIAAAFLQKFVDYPAWAHVDMAGMMSADGKNPLFPKGASGYGARLLADFTRRWSARSSS